ncbi:hypothetical protein NEOLEDRAFT_1101055 [Neolentinus lepideus HHB14362 ss-1]|uniref:Protein PBN1 n=1 Tax=Neolentinus lepideus HHB14362 ss-1 TaxID=1314782 RepID=A0A165NXN0_9AGAM|nr:hypothetical protein NEOLEDRAFT_1101055 [Neolentinus lepideus HHB14362 ss-1]
MAFAASTHISSLDPTQSFHSTLTTSITLDAGRSDTGCSLHITHAFPPDVFVDPYELVDQHADDYAFNLTGLVDVELPVSAVPPEGQTLSLRLIYPKDQKVGSQISVQVPIHARYGAPSETRYHDIILSSPHVVWHCPGIQGSTDTNTETISIPLSTSDSLTLRIPVADPRHLSIVEPATAAAVLGAFLVLAYTFAVAATALRKTKSQKYID